MMWQNQKENLLLAGAPIEELQNPSIEKRKSVQYPLSQLIERFKAKQIQILPEKFKEPEFHGKG